jgi:hypothetical protein
MKHVFAGDQPQRRQSIVAEVRRATPPTTEAKRRRRELIADDLDVFAAPAASSASAKPSKRALRR